jgi:hypothetical protein
MKIWRNLRLFSDFRRTLIKNRVTLEGNFNIRVDKAFRMYTVLNIPVESFGDAYNLRTSDIDTISQNYLRNYIRGLSDFLNSQGLSELYDFYDPIKKVGKYSYLIVLGFKPFNTVKYNNIFYFRIIPIVSILLLMGLLFFIL